MNFVLVYTKDSAKAFEALARKDPQRHRKLVKCLRLLGEDPRHPGLNSHKYRSKSGPGGEEIWESYVENNTPSAWRVFWYYGPDTLTERIITVVAITPHP